MILVTGGTGFIGKEIVRELERAEATFQVLVRKSGKSSPKPSKASLREELSFPGDVLDPALLNPAAQGCETVIHLVGIIREAGRMTFEKMHVEGTRNVVAAARRSGVQKILYMSALGARKGAVSRYHQTKWEAEEIVRGSGIPYVIFRPSIVVGEKDQFVNALARLIRVSPGILPVIGSGTNKFQPVWVGDVAACFVKAALDPRIANREYVLTGPSVITYDELLDAIMKNLSLQRRKIHVPIPLARIMAAALEIFPNPLLTRDQLLMLQEDNVGDNSAMKRDFGIEPRSLERVLRGYFRGA